MSADREAVSLYGKQGEWWNGLTDAHRQAIQQNHHYGLEEAFNAGWRSALRALAKGTPDDE